MTHIEHHFFNTEQVIIYPTYFSKLYLDPYYGDRSTVFTDKIQTESGQNSRPGEIDPYMYLKEESATVHVKSNDEPECTCLLPITFELLLPFKKSSTFCHFVFCFCSGEDNLVNTIQIIIINNVLQGHPGGNASEEEECGQGSDRE